MGLFDRFKSTEKTNDKKTSESDGRNYELEFKNAYINQDFDTVSEVINSWRDNVPDAWNDSNFLYASTVYTAILGISTNDNELKNQVKVLFERAGNSKPKKPEFNDWFIFAAIGARDSVR